MINLHGKKALVTGIINKRSIAWGVANALKDAGAEIGVTFLADEAGRMKDRTLQLTEPLEPAFVLPMDVQNDEQIDNTFVEMKNNWGSFDIMIHCLAFANREDINGDFSSTSRAGFQLALDVSAYSLIRLCHFAKPMINGNGSIITLSYRGGVKVVPNYNVMGAAKAALENNMRYLAYELGREKAVRVNCISAGPIKTLSSIAIGQVGQMLDYAKEKAPLKKLVTIEDVGNAAAFLASDLSSSITGQTIYVDAGFDVMGH